MAGCHKMSYKHFRVGSNSRTPDQVIRSCYNSYMFRCRKCGIEKSLDRFPKANNARGLKSTCRECYNEYYRNYYRNRPAQYEKHKGYVNKNDKVYKKAVHRHGLTDESFAALLDKYEGLCHSCREEFATVVDHDHSCCPQTNTSCGLCVRGLLCNGCNSALGFIKDSPGRARLLASYLEKR